MHPKIKEKIQKKILEKASKQDKRFDEILQGKTKFLRKDLVKLADLVGIDENTIFRFFHYGSCKPTHQLQPHNEQAIAEFLGFHSYEKLLEMIMIEFVFEQICNLLQKINS
jgi:hypothetical protein